MKRTAFKKKPYIWKRKPSTGLSNIPKNKTESDIPKKESKMEEWRRIKTEILIPYFISIGLISTCEIKGDRCLGSALAMQFAHSKKRDDIAKEEPERTRELCEVIRACTNCHYDIEHLPYKDGVSGKDQMYIIVINLIAFRNKRLARWKKVVA